MPGAATAARRWSAGHPSKPGPDAGFTLVELLVSLALIVLAMALLPNALGLGRRAWETHEQANAGIAVEARLVLLRQRIAEAMPYFESTGPGTAAIAFEGTPASLTFIAAGAEGTPDTGLRRWQLAHVTSGNRPSRLELVSRPALGIGADGRDPGADGEPDATVALDVPATSSSLAYFGRARPADPPDWHEAWPRTDQLPTLVAVTIRRPGGTAPRRIVVELKLAGR